jgi:4-hydroxybenzoate polyprenyltransferase
MSKVMQGDGKRFWWLPLVVITATMAGLWIFQRTMFPESFGWIGLIVGFFLGVGLTVLLEDYIDHHTD